MPRDPFFFFLRVRCWCIYLLGCRFFFCREGVIGTRRVYTEPSCLTRPAALSSLTPKTKTSAFYAGEQGRFSLDSSKNSARPLATAFRNDDAVLNEARNA